MGTLDKRWLLPEGVVEFLPEDAAHLENSRRRLLDLYTAWGYQLVIPPVIDHLESLLIGAGTELDLQTFKLTDQLSGRLLGISADMTPQVARIDAHHLKTNAPVRLCYMGTVLRTRPTGLTRTRSPFQVGAELYGHGGMESDLEMIRLMLETLNTSGFKDYYIDLGHLGIYNALIQKSGLSADNQQCLFDAVQRKAISELKPLLKELSVPAELCEGFMALVTLSGGSEVIEHARQSLQGLGGEMGHEIMEALNLIEALAKKITQLFPDVNVHIDLAELQGYHYQTGVVFAAYLPGHGGELARGGRYDGIAQASTYYGERGARSATGFSMDLNALILLQDCPPQKQGAIFSPAVDETDTILETLVSQLRKQGETVIYELPNQGGTPIDMGCDRQLKKNNGQWYVEAI